MYERVCAYLLGTAVVAVATGVLSFLWFKKKSTRRTLVDPSVKYPVRLVDKEVITHNTTRFIFALSSEEHILGLPIGQNVYVSAEISGDLVVRPYTPVTDDDLKGYFHLVLKIYKSGVDPRFPDGGKMSQYLDSLPIGAYIHVRGPSGNIIYERNGVFQIRQRVSSPRVSKKVSRVGMIAGGTGITPMYQLIQWILKHPDDKVEMSLLYANQSEDDILLREDLESFSHEHPNQFKLWYTLDRPSDEWSYSSGFINEQIIQEHLPPPGPDVLILLCGPPPMIDRACRPSLEKLGYTESMFFVY